MAIVKLFSYRAAAYQGITEIIPILAGILAIAPDKNYFAHTFIDFTKRGFTR